jgi:hypothetical protein
MKFKQETKQTITVTPEQLKAISSRFNRGDNVAACNSAAKFAVKNQRNCYLLITAGGYTMANKPNTTCGYYEFIPEGNKVTRIFWQVAR